MYVVTRCRMNLRTEVIVIEFETCELRRLRPRVRLCAHLRHNQRMQNFLMIRVNRNSFSMIEVLERLVPPYLRTFFLNSMHEEWFIGSRQNI